jgi:hypothetical protein
MPDDDEDGGGDSDESDRKGGMSVSYWGADEMILHKPMAKYRPSPPPGELCTRSNGPAVPSSRRNVATPTSPPATSDEGHSVKITVTRPAWDESTHPPVTNVQSMKWTRNSLQNSAATWTTTTPLTGSSPHLTSGVEDSEWVYID